jgi:hypothetical protein
MEILSDEDHRDSRKTLHCRGNAMRWTRTTRRRIAVVFALVLPLLLVLMSLEPADAQFPKGGGFNPPGGGFRPPGGFNPPGGGFNPPGGVPPGGGFNPPGGGFNPPGGVPPGGGFNPPGGGFNPPGGGFNPPGGMPPGGGFNPPGGPGNPPFGPGAGGIQHEWRCSKCKAVIATTSSPFPPNIQSCPRCGVNFINGGKWGINPPPNFPGSGGPPAGGPPAGGPPGGVPPGNAPPPGPPPGGPPNEFVPPPANPAPQAPPANAPPAAANDEAPRHQCHWCSAAVTPGTSYCTGCTLKIGGIVVIGAFMLLAVTLVPVGLVLWYTLGSSRR